MTTTLSDEEYEALRAKVGPSVKKEHPAATALYTLVFLAGLVGAIGVFGFLMSLAV